MDLLAHIADQALNQPLALLPKKAPIIAAVLGERIGLDGDMKTFDRSVSGPPMARREPVQSGAGGYLKTSRGVAIVTVVGTLVPRAGYLEAESGLLSHERLKSQVRAADQDKDVTSIMLDLHTPGGAVAGCFECAEFIHQVSSRRPVVAVANSMACSAGFAILRKQTPTLNRNFTVCSIGFDPNKEARDAKSLTCRNGPAQRSTR